MISVHRIYLILNLNGNLLQFGKWIFSLYVSSYEFSLLFSLPIDNYEIYIAFCDHSNWMKWKYIFQQQVSRRKYIFYKCNYRVLFHHIVVNSILFLFLNVQLFSNQIEEKYTAVKYKCLKTKKPQKVEKLFNFLIWKLCM